MFWLKFTLFKLNNSLQIFISAHLNLISLSIYITESKAKRMLFEVIPNKFLNLLDGTALNIDPEDVNFVEMFDLEHK